MRLPKYLSNSSLKAWEEDREEFYLRYLCDQKTPKVAQSRPMAVGSSFDGLVKAKIESMLGMPVRDYSGQIEARLGTPEHAQAMADGKEVMEFYTSVRGISRLIVTGTPRMEFSVEGAIPGTESCIGGPVKLLGKPDLYYRIAGYRVVHDWKVNGFCSKASPQKGYVWDSKTTSAHKDVTPKVVRAGDACLMIGRTDYFNPEWLDQETGYGWLLGEALGDEYLLQVHQITREASGGLRLTEHRVLSDRTHQLALRDRYVGLWEAIHCGRCFTDLDAEGDKARQREMDQRAAGMQDPVFNMVCGR